MTKRRRAERGSMFRVMRMAALLAAMLTGFGGASSGQPGSPDPQEANKECLICHATLLEAETLKPDVKEAHRRHLESTMTEFGGRQRVCTTCHEAFGKRVEGTDGWFPIGSFFHPATSNHPTGYWRLRVRKREVSDTPAVLPLLAPEDPQIFKPTLKRLVCLECHSRKLKVFYPAEPKR